MTFRYAYLPSAASVSDAPTIAHEKGRYRVIKGCDLKEEPYAAAKSKGAVEVGDMVDVVAIVKNKYDNMWVKTSDGYYIYAGYTLENGSYVEEGNMHLQLASNNVTCSISGASPPSGTLQEGKLFSLRGTVNCSNSIQKIVATVKGPKNISSQTVFSDTLTTSKDIYPLDVNMDLSFGSLPKGSYTFELTVHYYYDRLQKVGTYTPPGCKTTFTIGSGSSSQPTPDQWVYKIVASAGVNMRSSASTSGSIVTTLFPPTTITVTKKTTANGYTWGYGTSSNGKTGWIVVDNSWTQLVSSSTSATVSIDGRTQPASSIPYGRDVELDGKVNCSAYIRNLVGTVKSGSNAVLGPVTAVYTNNYKTVDIAYSHLNYNMDFSDLPVGNYTYEVVVNYEGGSKTFSYPFRVAGVNVTGISLSRTSLSLNTGASSTLTATISPSNATNKNVTWTSSNTAVATVSGGKVTAVGNGTATITCKTADGGYTAKCTVTVTTKVTGVKLSASSATLDLSNAAQKTLTLTATISPSTASNKNVTWTSRNTAVATVSGLSLIHIFGAESINPVRDIQLQMLAAMRQAVDCPLDIHTENPKSTGGFIRHYEVPEMVRVAAPIYLKTGGSVAATHSWDSTEDDARKRAKQCSLVKRMLDEYYPEAVWSPRGSLL